jgi:hypothetical protein
MQHYNRGTHKWETRNELNNEVYPYYWWDYYDDVNDFRYYEDPIGVNYDYIKTSSREERLLQRRGLLRYPTYIKDHLLQIDMMSIYSKEMLRQKKIDMILDDIQDLSNTIENLLQSKGIQISLDKS